MRRLLVILMLLGAFVGGYHLGRRPGSPDILAVITRVCGSIASEAGEVLARLMDKPSDGDSDQPKDRPPPDRLTANL